VRMSDRRFSRRRAMQAGAGAAGIAAGARFVSYPKRSSAQGTTLRLSTFASTDEQAVIQTQLDAFATETGITVNLEAVPTDYPTALTTALAAGEAADVFWVDSLLAPDLYTRGLLLPMDEAVGADALADYFPNLLAGYQYQGQTLGLPKDWSALAMWYNTDLFEQGGVTAAPTTWDELQSALEAVTDATGIPGLVVPDPARELVFEYQAGGGILSDDLSEVVIGGQPTVDALTFYYGLYSNGIATTPADAGANDQGQAFGQQLGSMAYEGNWNYLNYDNNFPDLPYAVAPLPAGPSGDRATFAFTVAYSIFAGTPNAEAAVQLVQFLNSDEIMLNLTTTAGVMPSRSSLTSQWLEQFPERQLFVDAAEYARPWQLGPGGQLFYSAASSTLQELFAGGLSPEEAAAQLRTDAEQNIQLQTPGGTPAATPAS
jgi:multiple sugar transport system substrate-binding protein